MNKAGKFSLHMEKVYVLLNDLCKESGSGLVQISNDCIASMCGFKKSRQVKEYLIELKKQRRVFVRLLRMGKGQGSARYISTQEEIGPHILEEITGKKG